MRLALLFIGLPLLELYILIKIGSYLGPFLTIALIIFSGLLGLLLARFEGLRTLHQMRQNLSQGILPAEEMLDSVLIFAGGVLFVVPGVLTDYRRSGAVDSLHPNHLQALAAAAISTAWSRKATYGFSIKEENRISSGRDDGVGPCRLIQSILNYREWDWEVKPHPPTVENSSDAFPGLPDCPSRFRTVAQ